MADEEKAYTTQQGTKGGADPGHSESITENAAGTPGQDEGSRSGGTHSGPAGVTGQDGRSMSDREGPGFYKGTPEQQREDSDAG